LIQKYAADEYYIVADAPMSLSCYANDTLCSLRLSILTLPANRRDTTVAVYIDNHGDVMQRHAAPR